MQQKHMRINSGQTMFKNRSC